MSKWKKQVLSELPEIFKNGRKPADLANEQLVAQLYQQIGQLKVELDWLQKNRPSPLSKNGRWWPQAGRSWSDVSANCFDWLVVPSTVGQLGSLSKICIICVFSMSSTPRHHFTVSPV